MRLQLVSLFFLVTVEMFLIFVCSLLNSYLYYLISRREGWKIKLLKVERIETVISAPFPNEPIKSQQCNLFSSPPPDERAGGGARL